MNDELVKACSSPLKQGALAGGDHHWGMPPFFFFSKP